MFVSHSNWQQTSSCHTHTPVVFQVAVEQVLQAAVQAEGDEEAVEVESEGRAVTRDGRRGGHHPSTLSESPQQLLQVRQLGRDEHASPGPQTYTERHEANEGGGSCCILQTLQVRAASPDQLVKREFLC